jgi:hypothetical protein
VFVVAVILDGQLRLRMIGAMSLSFTGIRFSS